MRLDLTKTNGSSPPPNAPTQTNEGFTCSVCKARSDDGGAR